MVHKRAYQQLADEAAKEIGTGYALHIGKIGEEKFVYTILPPDSREYRPECQTIITVEGDNVETYSGADADAVLKDTRLREFSTGRAIFKKYQVLVKNKSAIIGEGLPYAEAIVNAIDSKAIKASLLYPYLEVADMHRLKIKILKDGTTDSDYLLLK